MGLHPHRDRLCVGRCRTAMAAPMWANPQGLWKGHCRRAEFEALLTNPKITKIFHFAGSIGQQSTTPFGVMPAAGILHQDRLALLPHLY